MGLFKAEPPPWGRGISWLRACPSIGQGSQKASMWPQRDLLIPLPSPMSDQGVLPICLTIPGWLRKAHRA